MTLGCDDPFLAQETGELLIGSISVGVVCKHGRCLGLMCRIEPIPNLTCKDKGVQWEVKNNECCLELSGGSVEYKNNK